MRRGAAWSYRDRRTPPPGGIDFVSVRKKTTGITGRLGFRLRGREGAYPVSPGDLPLRVTLVVDPPAAETGQCAAATFSGPAPPRCAFNAAGSRLSCRQALD